MTKLAQLLDDATTDVAPVFSADDIRRRVRRRSRRRLVGRTAVVALVLGAGAAAVLRDGTDPSSRLTAKPPPIASPWSGRWVAFAFSAVGTGPTSRSPEIILDEDGSLRGFDGCDEISGTWKPDGTDHLLIDELSAPSSQCDASASTNPRLLRRVLASRPAIGQFDEIPDSMKLTAGSEFVGAMKDVAYATTTDPARSDEILDLGAGHQLVADTASVGISALPAEVRFQRWRAIGRDREVSMSRTLGGMPFSARAIILATTGAMADEVTINGTVGAIQIGPADVVAITWSPQTDITLSLRTDGTPFQDTLELAQQVRYDRGKLRAQTLTRARGMRNADVVRPAEVAASGEVNRVPWKFVVYADASGVCRQLLFPQGASGSCGPWDSAMSVEAVRVLGGQVVHGSVPNGSARVRIEWDGGSLEARASPLTGFTDELYFGATIPGDLTVRRVIALGDHGEEVGRNEDVSGGAIGAG